MYIGVTPFSLALLTCAPNSISAPTTASWPLNAAMSSGVTPSSIALLTSTPNSISARTTASWPF